MTREEAYKQLDGAEVMVFNRDLEKLKEAVIVALNALREPVKRGRWIINTDDFTPAYRCSVCSYNKPMIAGEKAQQGAMNYCPHCGAQMDLE